MDEDNLSQALLEPSEEIISCEADANLLAHGSNHLAAFATKLLNAIRLFIDAEKRTKIATAELRETPAALDAAAADQELSLNRYARTLVHRVYALLPLPPPRCSLQTITSAIARRVSSVLSLVASHLHRSRSMRTLTDGRSRAMYAVSVVVSFCLLPFIRTTNISEDIRNIVMFNYSTVVGSATIGFLLCLLKVDLIDQRFFQILVRVIFLSLSILFMVCVWCHLDPNNMQDTVMLWKFLAALSVCHIYAMFKSCCGVEHGQSDR